MKKSIVLVVFPLFLLTFAPPMAFSQKYVNKEFSSTTGLPLNLTWAASHLTDNENQLTVDVQNLPSGIYLIKLKSIHTVSTHKFLKQ